MVYFVRHGESQANLDGVYAGQLDDSPLTAKGVSQAETAGEDIKRSKLQFGHIVCSPLSRSQKTARIIASAIGFDPDKIEIDERITEYDMGRLTGKPMDRPSAQLVAAAETEDVHKFQHRVMVALAEYAKLPSNTLVVGHAGVAKIVEATRTHQAPHIFLDLDGYPHGKVTALTFLNEQ